MDNSIIEKLMLGLVFSAMFSLNVNASINRNRDDVMAQRAALIAVAKNDAELRKKVLIAAAKKGDLAAISELSEGKKRELKNVNVKDKNGWTPLMWASFNNRFKVVKYLVEHNARLCWENNENDTALTLALKKGNVEIAKYLIEEGVKVNHILKVNVNAMNNYGETPLILASEKGYLDIVKLLIANKADVNLQSKGFASIIKDFWLKNSKNPNIKQMLIDLKKRNIGNTALHAASFNGHIEVVKFLIANGANVDAKNMFDSTALHAASFNGHIEVVKYLIRLGANVNAKDKNRNTALHAASSKGHIEVVKYLVRLGASVDAKSKNRNMALHAASFNGHIEVVKYLIRLGASVNAKNKNGNTALHIASFKGHLEIVEFLIANKANINAKNKLGSTVLMAAIYGGHIEVMEFLIKSQVNVNATNNKGETALILAKKKGYSNIVSVLEQSIKAQENPVSENNDSNVPNIDTLLKHNKLQKYFKL